MKGRVDANRWGSGTSVVLRHFRVLPLLTLTLGEDPMIC
jgi:hypothetical protein